MLFLGVDLYPLFSFFPIFSKESLGYALSLDVMSVVFGRALLFRDVPSPLGYPSFSACDLGAFQSTMLGKADEWHFYLISLIIA